MQEQEIMKMAQAVAAAMVMFSELAKSQNVALRQEAKQEAKQEQQETEQEQQEAKQEQTQEKPKLKFVPFGRFSTLRISTAETESGTIVNVRKGEQFVTFLFNQEVAKGLLELINQYHPDLLVVTAPNTRKKGRGA
jgi:hemolysin activation/secretion protein